MRKSENSKEATQDVTQCYGISCDCCAQRCEFKTAGESLIAEKKHDRNVSSGATKIFDYKELEGEGDAPLEFIAFSEVADTSLQSDNAANVLRLFYWALKAAPKGTMAILERAFEGTNQSDIARRQGVTRQAISKMYKGELQTLAKLMGIKQPNLPESRLWQLNTLEFQIMQIIHQTPDATERQMAEKLGKTQPTIHRAKCSAMRKLYQIPPSKPMSKRIRKKTA